MAEENPKALWSGRFSKAPDQLMKIFGESISVDWAFYKEDIEGSKAHGKMLEKIGILTSRELEKILGALDEIKEEIESGDFVPNIELEDVHMNIENRLITKLGDLGAKIHTGRSRNDQVLTDYRLYLKKEITHLSALLRNCLEVFLQRAKTDIDIIIPGFTHLMHAQPISLGQYWMAYFWKLQRDYDRLQSALRTVDVNPLGVGALAGSTLPLDREYTRELLGFKTNSKNSLDTVSDRDFIMDLQYALSTIFIHTSRLSEDLIIWSTQEFNYLELPDEFCTGSSMMPNKKNPDALELIRGKTATVVTGLFNLMMNLKGLPLSYNRDLQEDKKFVLENIETAKTVLEILPQLIEKIEVKEDAIEKHLEKGFLLATDVAEYLVLKSVPFRSTHEIVGKIVQYCEKKGLDFKDLSMEEWKGFSGYFDEDILEILTPKKAVERRETLGGTGKKQVLAQIQQGLEWVKGKG